MIRLFERLMALAKLRDLEQRLQHVIDLLRTDLKDATALLALAIQRESLSKQLAQARAEYVAEFMAPGERLTFEVA